MLSPRNTEPSASTRSASGKGRLRFERQGALEHHRAYRTREARTGQRSVAALRGKPHRVDKPTVGGVYHRDVAGSDRESADELREPKDACGTRGEGADRGAKFELATVHERHDRPQSGFDAADAEGCV